jgi:protease I
MAESLQGLRVAILVDNGFEQVELTEPQKALEAAGATTLIVSPQDQQVKGWQTTDWGDTFPVDVPLDMANPADYGALLLPGGVMNPDKLRMQPDAVEFVRAFFTQGKPVAAICHGPWTLVEANVIRGKTLTSWPSLQTDIRNAGGHWVDQDAVVDGLLLTSRKPDDIPVFNDRMVSLFASKSIGAQAGATVR